MILTIDVGNTRIKGAVFEKDIAVAYFVFKNETLQSSIENILKEFSNVTDLVVASVGNIEKQAFLNFEKYIEIRFISHSDKFPFRIPMKHH